MLPTKNLPGHFKRAIRDNLTLSWLVRVGKGEAESPPAQSIPVLDAGNAFQPDEVLTLFL